MNPYQGLKLRLTGFCPVKAQVLINMNPYQGLKPRACAATWLITAF